MMVTDVTADIDKQLDIIESLYPDFTEYADNKLFHHWMEYACELDEIMNVVYRMDDGNSLVAHLNQRMLQLRSTSAEYNACVDVASTFEEALPTLYKGVFKYE